MLNLNPRCGPEGQRCGGDDGENKKRNCPEARQELRGKITNSSNCLGGGGLNVKNAPCCNIHPPSLLSGG